MAHGKLVLALNMIAAATPTWAARGDRPMTAPAGTSDIRYCMRIYAVTGRRVTADDD